MFISRIPLNIARVDARQLVGSPYRMHAAVESSFPPDSVRESDDGRILWRLDSTEHGKGLWLYVVSPEKPDFTHIVEQAGWPLHPEWETKDYGPLLDRVAIGQRWRFRLRANPVRKARTDQGKRSRVNADNIIGKMQGHVTVAHQTDWLLQRAPAHGFAVSTDTGGNADVIVSQRQREQFRRDNGMVTLTTATFDGCLEITDAELFRHALCHGIGRAKGFGCGLLTIAPIREQQ